MQPPPPTPPDPPPKQRSVYRDASGAGVNYRGAEHSTPPPTPPDPPTKQRSVYRDDSGGGGILLWSGQAQNRCVFRVEGKWASE